MNNLLFSISMFHQYYDNGRIEGVSLIAKQRTQRFLDRYELVTRQGQGVFSFYYFGSADFKEFSASLGQLLNQQPLVFNVKTDAQTFINISDLPLDRLGVLKYSSHNIAPESLLPGRLLAVEFENETPLLNVVGEISIHPCDLFDHLGQRVNSHFNIEIQARKTQWDYYVFNPSGVKLDNPRIYSRDGVDFETPVRVSLDGDDDVLLFSSGAQRFALKQSAQQSFDLLNSVQSLATQATQGTGSPQADKRLINGLPTPSANQISIKTDNGQGYACSEMYVYL